MVVIRLARGGRRNRPFHQIVVKNKKSSRDGRFIENIGQFDPLDQNKASCKIDLERYDYWIGTGAQASPTVAALAKNARKTSTKS